MSDEILAVESDDFKHPVCGPNCPQLRHDAPKDKDWCALTDWWLPGEDVVCVPLLDRELDKLTAWIEEAERLIQAAVGYMTPEQVGRWQGVRAWLEEIDEVGREEGGP